MIFEYTGRHIEVTPALRKHTEDHFDKIKHLFEGTTAKANVVLEVEKGRHRSEMIVHWRNEVLTATTILPDMYKSISQSISKIEKQVLKLKKKVVDKSHRAKRSSKPLVKEADEVQPSPIGPRVIKERKYLIKPATVEEALLMLEDRKEDFLVFRSSDDQKVSVLYKRKDGNFGLIEP